MQGRPEEQICQFARWSCYSVKRQAGVLSGPAGILSLWQGVVADMVRMPLFVFAGRREKARISLAVRTQSGLIWATKIATYSVEGA